MVLLPAETDEQWLQAVADDNLTLSARAPHFDYLRIALAVLRLHFGKVGQALPEGACRYTSS